MQQKTVPAFLIIKLAYSARMIDDEKDWLELLDMQNEVAHSYNDEVAVTLIERTKERYLALFEKLEAEISAI